MDGAISLLGSTGSIGRQTLEVAEMLGLRVLAVSAERNIRLLEEQTRRFRPSIAAVFDDKAALDFKTKVRDLDVRVVSGIDGLIEAARVDGADTVVTAVVGTVGLLPTLEAIDLGRRIALANKETLVCAGELVMKRARLRGCEIIPVDSEHSALLQCLREEPHGSVEALTLTASGGPFRGMSRDELRSVTPEMALRHPNWDMGKKITVDSATMMNKGLEVIEAVHLFSVPPEKIKVVVHPESIVHSMVEFADNSVIAQLSLPDMRLPIQYALTYPQRTRSLAGKLDIARLGALTFEEPDMEAFPCLRLALETSRIRGTACAVLNAANEAAVAMFLNGSLGFYGIYDCVLAALDSIGNIEDPSLEDIIAADREAKRFVIERFWG
jgi:1-deoxy-D-xylulose-5-phosphate reductoisomerase